MRVKSTVVVVMATCLAAVTAACGGSSDGSEESGGQEIVISVPGKSIALPAPWLAEAKGLFEKHGVNVKVVTVQPGTDLAQLGAGKVDLIMSGLSAGTLNAIDSGLDLKWVAPGYESNPESAMGVYLKDKYFDDDGNLQPDELKGAQIAVTQSGSLQDHTILSALEGSSTKYSDLKVQRLENVDIFSALEAGKLDGGFLSSPFYANLSKDAGYQLGMKPFSPSYVLYLAGPSTEGKSEELTKFFCAIKEVQADLLEPGFNHDAESLDALTSTLGISRDTIENDPSPNLFKADLEMDKAEDFVASMQANLMKAGFLEYTEPIKGEEFIDRSYIEADCA